MPRKPLEERRKEILSTAWRLFQERGYRNVNMEHISAAIGIARTTLYEYFSSKEQMLLTLAEEIADELHSGIATGDTCLEQLENMASEYLDKVLDNRAFYRILFREAPVLSAEVSQKLLQWREEQLRQVVAIAVTGISSGELRADITSANVGFLFQAVIGQRAGELLMVDRQSEPADEAKRLVQLIWKGIRN